MAAYQQHNLFNDPLFRLNQFSTLCKRLLNIIENENIKTCIIAGDFFNVAAPRPIIVNRGVAFLEALATKTEVYIIRGNHDVDARSGEITKESTLLSVCDRLLHVNHCHKEFRDIGGGTFYFLGWAPNTNEEIEFLRQRGGCDVFIGHFQPGRVSIGQRGQFLDGGITVLDSPPWKIGVVGDIHTHQVCKGNIIIPGVPIAHNFNDPLNPSVIILDTKTLEWKRIFTIVPGQWDFLQFSAAYNGPNDIISSNNPYIVKQATLSDEHRQIQKTFEKRLDVASIIDEEVKKHHLELVHKEILHCVPKEITREVNLNFTLERLVIHNFRSIQHFEWDNMKGGVVLLYGDNGTGKSSLVDALMFALSGNGSGRTLKRKGSDELYVEITLFYDQRTHTLRRGWTTSGKLRYWVNDVEQQAENQRALLEKIEDNLPFIRFTDLFYHQQDRPGFLSSYNYAARVDLISRVLGLRIVQALHDEANKRLLDFDQQLATLRSRIATVNAIVEQEALVEVTFMEEVIDDGGRNKENNLTMLRNSLRSLVSEERRKHTEISTQKTTLVGRIERTTNDVATLTKRRNEFRNGRRCFNCGKTVDDEEYEVLFERDSKEISSKTTDLIKWKQELSSLGASPPSTDLLIRLENRLDGVVQALSQIVVSREYKDRLARFTEQIERAKSELLTLRTEQTLCLSKRGGLQDYTRLLDSSGSIMRTLLFAVSEIFNLNTNNNLRVQTHKTLVNGEIRPDFDVEIKVNNTWVPYDSASGGQKTLADIMILEKVVQLAGGIGILILDESLRFLDGRNVEKVVDVVKNIGGSTIFIVSHLEGFPYFDTSIFTNLNSEDGSTMYTFE